MSYHEPVMLEEVLQHLAPAQGETAIDGTVGSAGHARAMAHRLGSKGALIALDRDPAMLRVARDRLQGEFAPGEGPELHFFPLPYERVGQALEEAGKGKEGANVILLDLGLNSLQLEDPARGFAFSKQGPLDARFNAQEGLRTMGELINSATANELTRWLRDYGDERLAAPIARRIVKRREQKPFETTTELADLVTAVYPAGKQRIHAATRTFQALRIVVNDELGAVERGVRACLQALAPAGRLAVLTFHSGEDRIVKSLFREASAPWPDPSNPYQATSTEGLLYVPVTRGAVKSSKVEAALNPRSRSAKLRVIRRKREGES